MTVSIRRLKYVLAATSILTPLWALSASAQVEEIIVTAQKRAEKVQDVPIAITALSAEALESRRVATTTDLSAIAPNLTTGSTSAGAGDTAISMRGLPAADTLLSNDNPVGVYIDGVLNARLAGTVLDLIDLERVEVLRGPQGTLYGRNTTGGAINFITKPPADAFHVSEKLGYVDNNGAPGFTSRTTIDTGEIGKSGLRANFSFLYKKIGGYYDNPLTSSDKDPGSENVRAFRLGLAFDQGGRFRASYTGYYYAEENGNSAAQLSAISDGTNRGYGTNFFGTFNNLAISLVPGTYTIGGGRYNGDRPSLDKQTTDDQETYLHNLTWSYDLTDHLEFKSITGYRHYDDLVHGPDLDGNSGIRAKHLITDLAAYLGSFGATGFVDNAPVNLFFAQNKRKHEQFTQEVQFNGDLFDNKRLTYTVGGYYFLEHASERNPQSLILPTGAGIDFNGDGVPEYILGIINPTESYQTFNPFAFNTSTEAWAVFGQASYRPPILDDRMTFTIGLRYSADVKQLDLLSASGNLTCPACRTTPNTFPLLLTPVIASSQASFNNLSYMGKIQYKIAPDVMTYISYSTGYKAGGFNTRSVGLEPFQEETIEAYEWGLKADWLHRRLQTNLSVFYNIARNQQVAQFVAGAGGATNLVTNAGRSHYQGIEVEILAKPIESITFNLSMGYIDPQYDKYMARDPSTGVNGPLINVANNADFSYTSEVTASAGLQYDSEPMAWIGGGKFQGRVEVVYQSAQTFHPAIVYPSGYQDNPLIDRVKGDARTLVNGRVALSDIALGSTAATMEVALWAKNILDEAYVIQGIEFGALGFGEQNFGPPRTGGLDVTFKY